MTKEYLKFEELAEADQQWFLNESWCDTCNKADLGIKDPILYIQNGFQFIEGKCIVCGEPQQSIIIEKHINAMTFQ